MDIEQLERQMLGNLAVSPELWDNLTYLCDVCNGRFSGTEDERRAGNFAISRFKAYGLQNVAAEPFEMSGWERGEARLTIPVQGCEINLACIALPGSYGCDLEADIIDVGPGAAADFKRLDGQVAGKIVLTSSDGPGRSEKYRSALQAGAAGFIFASTRPGQLALTGSVHGDLPAVGMAYEPAARIRRALKAGPVKAHLSIDACVKTVTARNIIAEIPGTAPEAGWILAGGHYDGHDVAQGAQDNGAGAAVLMEAARLIAPLRSHLKAGIRFALFSGEELGLYGSHAYAKTHAAELDQVRTVFNADVVGQAMPLVLQTQASPELAAYFRTLPLETLDAVVDDGAKSFIPNSDHFPFSLAGLTSVMAVTSLPATDGHYVHTAGDTLDKLDPRVLRQTAATVARLLLRMAMEPDALPYKRRTPEEIEALLRASGLENEIENIIK